MNISRVAFVVQRYGIEVSGGAELHARLVAERMKKYWEIEVLTSCALDYITWKNHYKEGVEEINGILVRRFPVKRERNIERFGKVQERIFGREHKVEDEIEWVKENGPYYPQLIDWIKENKKKFDFFIFFSYRYFHSYFGINAVPEKSILVPTAEHDPALYLRIFRENFCKVRGILYNSFEECELIQNISKNYAVPFEIVGVGADVVKGEPSRFRKKFGIKEKFIIYIGRIDENKGCKELFDYYLRFLNETNERIRLVLIGTPVISIPSHPFIIHLGFVSDQDKFDALSASELLVMPSFYESLSIVTLEAFAVGKPVLANGNCEVLRGQIERSNGGLYYENYEEFRESLLFLLREKEIAEGMGKNGEKYFKENYSWDVIEGKYLRLLERIQ
jgi:glycosyltransferase involved in cell wall biosynthesis